MACFAVSAFALASAFAAAFSSSVKSVRKSMAASLDFRASSIAAFAAAFFIVIGLSLLIAKSPSPFAKSNASFVLIFTSPIAVKAFSLSAFTFAIASAFSSAVASRFELISTILLSAASLIASMADCLFKVMNSDKDLVSIEPSL